MPHELFSAPLRSSSAQAMVDERTSKASKILGADAPVQQANNKESDNRRSRLPGLSSKKSGSLTPFPTADTNMQPSNLRVRAGQDSWSEDASAPPIAVPRRTVHPSGSSSTLYSYFNFRDSTISNAATDNNGTKNMGFTDDVTSETQEQQDPRYNPKQQKLSSKESKRKIRPPRIDLSLLFPKPRATETTQRAPENPLLSPTRLVESPSRVSMASGFTSGTGNVKKAESILLGKKTHHRAPTPTTKISSIDPRQTASAGGALSPCYEDGDWENRSVEKTVRTNEMDLALQTPQSTTRGRSKSARSRTELSDLRPTQANLRKLASNSAIGGSNNDNYLSPKYHNHSKRASSNRTSTSPNGYQSKVLENVSLPGSSISRKSSNSTLKNSDLNKSSVLCLSSSEDEEEVEEDPAKHQSTRRGARDTIDTYGEFEPEICTATAAQPSRGGRLRPVERPISIKTSTSKSTQRQPSFRRNPSMLSAGEDSLATRRRISQRSSGVPAIHEPEFFHGDPIFTQLRSPTLSHRDSLKESNRRSRVIAVTQQEQKLLEGLRERKGKITPSAYQNRRPPPVPEPNGLGLEPDRNSMLSAAPSRDSFYGSDTSFLRLSAGFPPYPSQSNQGADQLDKDTSLSQGAASDAEQKTMNSSMSPRASLVYTESLPSPSTSGASPLTPTLPINSFSPLAFKPPPRHSPPPIPADQKQHSRRRTDSSEAIVVGEGETTPEKSEFPVWAYGWSNDNPNNVAPVH